MQREQNKGVLVVSLDFEMMWGCIDHKTLQDYGSAVEGVWEAIPQMLKVFEKYNIHATWGVVGLLALDGIKDCISNSPQERPQYTNINLSTYEHYEEVSSWDTKYLFAKALIERVMKTSFQEIGSHTYSHFYCMEEGQTKKEFKTDLVLAQESLEVYNSDVVSLIFPRNQVNDEYLMVLKELGFLNYRGNEDAWFCASNSQKVNNSLIRRALRLLDCYINISGYHCYDLKNICDNRGLNNIKSSRFFRPYSQKLHLLEPLRIFRIKRQMLHAAKTGQVFHLWWHPHNFGNNLQENISNLTKVCQYYEYLSSRYGMQSYNMKEVGEMVS